MSKLPTELVGCYQEWLEIARFEHQMIRERDWAKLNSKDAKKEKIIRRIEDLEPQFPEKSEDLLSLIHQLVDLEQLNQSLIQERSKEIKIQLNDIGRRTRLLNKFRGKYQDSADSSGQRSSQKA